MSAHQVAVIIPFRDRGTDPLRPANLKRVLHEWRTFRGMPKPIVEHDGQVGQFNRSKAYNRGIESTVWADIFIFTESDMLIDPRQLREAVELAAEPGLVVPFTEYHYLSRRDSERVRRFEVEPADCTPESVMSNGTSIGAINILSRETLEAVGQWDEQFEGSWFDDRAMCRAFEICTQPTRYVQGPAYHLYHQPGWEGDHLTAEDKAATERNRQRWKLYQRAKTPQRIRELTSGS